MLRRAAEVGRGTAEGNEAAGSGRTAVALKRNGMGGERAAAAARPLREPLPERSAAQRWVMEPRGIYSHSLNFLFPSFLKQTVARAG